MSKLAKFIFQRMHEVKINAVTAELYHEAASQMKKANKEFEKFPHIALKIQILCSFFILEAAILSRDACSS